MKSKKSYFLSVLICTLLHFTCGAQLFYFGADQSYVNEIEDCGAVYMENNQPKDVHQIYANHGCNLVRLRLWHTPSWYDKLNSGKRYSDLTDVKKSIRRAKENGMSVLLNFHLSDNWADPSKQVVPAAWLPIVDNLSILQDSLYRYIYNSLTQLAAEDLLPTMVQIGNETNRGILLSPEVNQQWTLDWERNAPLFNSGFQAVRDVSQLLGEPIQTMLHVAGPAETEWWIEEFAKNGVTDFDLIGMSYYWAWHKPTTIEETGQVIENLKNKYPGKDVIIVETGYLWTQENNDNANNIINEVHPDYLPISPETQKKWLVDLTKEVIASKGSGVVYWEPSWVSTSCWNQWDQGSHQEHATFFDFENNLLIPGGIEWMAYDYGLITDIKSTKSDEAFLIVTPDYIEISLENFSSHQDYRLTVSDTTGAIHLSQNIGNQMTKIPLNTLSSGSYIITVVKGKEIISTRKFIKIED